MYLFYCIYLLYLFIIYCLHYTFLQCKTSTVCLYTVLFISLLYLFINVFCSLIPLFAVVITQLFYSWLSIVQQNWTIYLTCRTYAVRRVKDAFREHKDVQDTEKLKTLIRTAEDNLEVMKRQVRWWETLGAVPRSWISHACVGKQDSIPCEKHLASAHTNYLLCEGSGFPSPKKKKYSRTHIISEPMHLKNFTLIVSTASLNLQNLRGASRLVGDTVIVHDMSEWNVQLDWAFCFLFFVFQLSFGIEIINQRKGKSKDTKKKTSFGVSRTLTHKGGWKGRKKEGH